VAGAGWVCFWWCWWWWWWWWRRPACGAPMSIFCNKAAPRWASHKPHVPHGRRAAHAHHTQQAHSACTHAAAAQCCSTQLEKTLHVCIACHTYRASVGAPPIQR
jgi:hypothetical protein